MTTNHADCAHEATKSARAACRKAKAAAQDARHLAIDGLMAAAEGDTHFDWITYGARRMAKSEADTITGRAADLLAHFAPSGDEAKDARRKANGYTITTDPREIRSIVLRAAS